MKARKYLHLVIILLAVNLELFSQLAINYFDQEPPGKTPVKFAEGFISKPGLEEICPVFSPDGTEFYYTECDDQAWSYFKVMVSKYIDGAWTTPVEADLPGEEFEVGCCFSPDGNTMFYSCCSDDWNIDIYKMEREGDGWGPAEKLPAVINDIGSAIATSVSSDSTIYFRSSEGAWNSGKMSLFFSPLTANGYETVHKIGYPASSDNTKEEYPTIAPDGSYLFQYRGISTNSAQLLISFRKGENEWTNPKNTGLSIDARQPGFCSITPDTSYLLYQGFDKDIYWVELESLVDSLRNSNYDPYVLNSLKDTSIQIGTEYSHEFSESVFFDDDGDPLTISAGLENGDGLPSWLEFNPATRLFSGTPVESATLKIKVTATDPSGSSIADIFVLTVKDPNSVNRSNISDKLEIYPNPASQDLIFVKNLAPGIKTNYQIITLAGQVLRSAQLENSSINISDLAPGIYVLNISSENKQTSIKIRRE